MLILTRKRNQAIVIGDDIVIRVTQIRGNQVELGIEAPTRIPVHRQEVYERVVEQNRQAASPSEETMNAIRALPLHLQDGDQEVI